jgi:hypothetical protein
MNCLVVNKGESIGNIIIGTNPHPGYPIEEFEYDIPNPLNFIRTNQNFVN